MEHSGETLSRRDLEVYEEVDGLPSAKLPYPNVILVVQTWASLAVIATLRRRNLVAFPRPTARKAARLFPMALPYAGNVSCSLTALRSLQGPMYSTLKRLTPMIVMLAKWRRTRVAPSRATMVAVSAVVTGCLIGYTLVT